MQEEKAKRRLSSHHIRSVNKVSPHASIKEQHTKSPGYIRLARVRVLKVAFQLTTHTFLEIRSLRSTIVLPIQTYNLRRGRVGCAAMADILTRRAGRCSQPDDHGRKLDRYKQNGKRQNDRRPWTEAQGAKIHSGEPIRSMYIYVHGSLSRLDAVSDAHFQQSKRQERRPSTVTCKKKNEDQTGRRQEEISPRDKRGWFVTAIKPRKSLSILVPSTD